MEGAVRQTDLPKESNIRTVFDGGGAALKAGIGERGGGGHGERRRCYCSAGVPQREALVEINNR